MAFFRVCVHTRYMSGGGGYFNMLVGLFYSDTISRNISMNRLFSSERDINSRLSELGGYVATTVHVVRSYILVFYVW